MGGISVGEVGGIAPASVESLSGVTVREVNEVAPVTVESDGGVVVREVDEVVLVIMESDDGVLRERWMRFLPRWYLWRELRVSGCTLLRDLTITLTLPFLGC